MKAQGKGSKSPLRDSFLRYPNNKYVLLVAARRHRRPGRRLVHGPVLRAVLPDHHAQARLPDRVHAGRRSRSLLATPFFVVFGRLSDRIGRLKIILAGCLLAALTYFPLFQGPHPLRQPGARGVPADERRSRWRRATATSTSSSARTREFTDCDRAKDFLTKSGLSFESLPAVAGAGAW